MPDEELGDDLMTEAARLEERRDEIIETNEAEAVYSEADRKRAGVIVTIGDEGGFLIHQGLDRTRRARCRCRYRRTWRRRTGRR